MSDIEIGHYGDRVFSHGHERELDRLHSLARVLDEDSFRRLDALPLGPDWRCLDIGAGLGTVSRWLARRCPRGRVVAMDIDVSLLSPEGYETAEKDVTRDEFPEGSFDLIHARWVFAHLPSRDADIARVVRWLAPGGWLIVEDPTQFPLESSPHPLYRKVTIAMGLALRRRFGTDRQWARTFPAPLRAAGLVEIGTEVSVPVTGPGPTGRFWRLGAEQLADDLREQFGVTDTELAEFAELVEHPSFSDFSMATVAAWGRRPA